MADVKESMGNLLWDDLYNHIKFAHDYILCAQNYVNKMRKRKRIADIALVVVLCIDAICCKYLAEYAWLIVSVTVLLDFLKDCAPKIFQPETELSELDKIQETLLSIRNNLEEAIFDFINHPDVSDIQIQARLTKEKKRLESITPQYNKLVRRISKAENIQFNNEAENYVKSKFNKI